MIQSEQTQALLDAEDERRVEQLLVRYCTGIDQRDWSLLRSCFTDDFQGDYGQFGTWNSGDEITAAMDKMHRGLGPTLHRLSNIVSRAMPGGARTRSYIDAVLTSLNPGDAARQGIGYYDDELVATTAGWKIRRRRFTAVRIV